MVSQFLKFVSFPVAGVVTVKWKGWTSLSTEIGLSTASGSFVLMFEVFFVLGVVTVQFTSGVVSSGENRLDSGWVENRLGWRSDCELLCCG